MPQIYIMALLTTLLALLGIGGFLRWKSLPAERPFLLTLLLLELPMCALAYYCIRLPLLDVAWQHLVGIKSPLYDFLRIFDAPLTEEPAKIWLLLFPAVRRRINRDNFWRVAIALGLGFGIGELWFIAYTVTQAPQFANLPWYQFTGFLNERLMVCLMHGGFVTATLFFFTRRKFILGLALAMLLHLLGNFPIYLAIINFPNFGPQAWGIILGLWVPTYFLFCLALLTLAATGGLKLGQFIFGHSTCPECHKDYPSSLLALNLVTKRLERCPHCKHWHLIPYSRFKAQNDTPPPPNP